jgi:hypothetical protein
VKTPPILKVYFKINIFNPLGTQPLFKVKHPDFQGLTEKQKKIVKTPPILKVYFKINIFKEKHPRFSRVNRKAEKILKTPPDFQGYTNLVTKLSKTV